MTTQHLQLAVNELYKSFNQTPILQGISLQAQSGDVLALLGSSGSGKSTLLRCINLLEVPDAGSMRIAGEEIILKQTPDKHTTPIATSQVARLRRKVGMVFQQFNLWPHMTVLENVTAAPITVLKEKPATAIKKAIQLLEKVGMAHKQQNYPSQLSGGQQQRIAIARALAMDPEILLFDEPTSALDPEKVQEVLQVIKALAAEGKTMLIATHEMHFARQVASQVVFLDHGKIHEQGAPKEMFANPQTPRFKQFIESTQATGQEY